jgi:hypothetical protein
LQELSPSKIEYFEHIVRQADALAVERCVMIMTARDFSGELKKLDRKVLILHGDSDQGKKLPVVRLKTLAQ